MSSPLFNALGAKQQPNMMQQFQSFMNAMQGKDVNAEISRFVEEHHISQQQLDQVQKQAQQMQSMFAPMRGMFGK